MSESLIEKVTNNNYKVLKILYENQVVKKDGTIFTPITQAEIANKLELSKITINIMFKELQESGLVYHCGTNRGRYCLTKKAIIIIKGLEYINKSLNE
ncbi:winged helix-turn-helix transcriptional regulator [Clostridium perfringens]|uniref:winged helix-turn-helix transcriptional regulator n=1 Tax=Clostridium perfringens TaxID=1502 RepID=UPI001C8578A6|nr:winged helix-turn-helix transcriptional regulator [Clostridium perfringens]MDM0633071.1 winged helix-turn-helix transcriptional regulator [Clostridium perfringens]WDT39694.1 winged helix-turn-helix transcriptional regulator [Clostridium perfringens]